MNDPKPVGERIEDVVESVVSSASPHEDDSAQGGTDIADRSGNEALGDDESFNA